MSEPDARARIAAQADDRQRRAAADIWLDNEAGLDELAAAVDELWADRVLPWERNLRDRRRVRRAPQVVLAPADPGWQLMAVREIRRIRYATDAAGLSERVLGIDHIGSTAVPGLPAKPVIDLQVRVRSWADATGDALAGALLAAGLVTDGERWDHVHDWLDPEPTGWRKVLAGGTDPAVVYHVHVREHLSAAARAALLLRDWLRRTPAEREAYAAAKAAVAGAVDYTAAKAPWVGEALRRADAWAVAVGWRGPVEVPEHPRPHPGLMPR